MQARQADLYGPYSRVCARAAHGKLYGPHLRDEARDRDLHRPDTHLPRRSPQRDDPGHRVQARQADLYGPYSRVYARAAHGKLYGPHLRDEARDPDLHRAVTHLPGGSPQRDGASHGVQARQADLNGPYYGVSAQATHDTIKCLTMRDEYPYPL